MKCQKQLSSVSAAHCELNTTYARHALAALMRMHYALVDYLLSRASAGINDCKRIQNIFLLYCSYLL